MQSVARAIFVNVFAVLLYLTYFLPTVLFWGPLFSICPRGDFFSYLCAYFGIFLLPIVSGFFVYQRVTTHDAAWKTLYAVWTLAAFLIAYLVVMAFGGLSMAVVDGGASWTRFLNYALGAAVLTVIAHLFYVPYFVGVLFIHRKLGICPGDPPSGAVSDGEDSAQVG